MYYSTLSIHSYMPIYHTYRCVQIPPLCVTLNTICIAKSMTLFNQYTQFYHKHTLLRKGKTKKIFQNYFGTLYANCFLAHSYINLS